jgi:hypothetical protein
LKAYNISNWKEIIERMHPELAAPPGQAPPQEALPPAPQPALPPAPAPEQVSPDMANPPDWLIEMLNQQQTGGPPPGAGGMPQMQGGLQ